MPTGAVPAIPRIKFVDSAGNPVAGGSLTVYLAGTTTPANSYQDKALTILNTSPIPLDGNGEALVWLDASAQYKLLLKDSLGSTLPGWPVDNVLGVDSDLRADLAATTGAALVGTSYGTLADAAPIASPAFTGTPTAPTQTTGNNTTRLATTAFVQATSIGGTGQAWQNVTASRALATQYTNDTGRAIMVSATVAGTVATSTIAASWTVGGVAGVGSVSLITGGVPANTSLCAQALVPPGATYQLDVTQASLSTWLELR